MEYNNKLKVYIKRMCVYLLQISVFPYQMIQPTNIPKLQYNQPLIEGKLVYHSYSDYNARDSKLYLFDFQTKEKVCLNEYFSDVYHTMNASFNKDGSAITFMGLVDKGEVEEWDIFLYYLETEELYNLTQNNNLRNEDPKFSPDGTKVIYKQGYWDHTLDCMVYDIWELDLLTKYAYAITEDIEEQSMPYYNDSGDVVYYMQGSREYSKILKMAKGSGKPIITEVYAEQGIQVYYPVIYNDMLYFSKWISEENKSDMIVAIDLNKNQIEVPAFNNVEYNASDPCPISDRLLIISSTMPGGQGGYDLYIVDRLSGQKWSLNELGVNINDEFQQLGASCYIESID